ncbi:hypothetical protein AwErysi_07650 [Erysipelotrichaceae bacterium]|nr:hypothetical protein AwErysi_07650 [Erysipelotrichaceae bacterium]
MYENKIEEIKGWNWGAFISPVMWGIGNKSYLPLLVLVPFLNIVWIFVCGAKANEWAWKSNNYTDVKTFKAVQATWNRAGLVMFILSMILLILGMVVVIAAAMSANESM